MMANPDHGGYLEEICKRRWKETGGRMKRSWLYRAMVGSMSCLGENWQ